MRSNPTFLPIYLVGGVGDIISAVDAIEFLANKYQIQLYTPHQEAFAYFSPIPTQRFLPDLEWYLEFNTVARFRKTDSFIGFLLPDHLALHQQQQSLFQDNPALRSMVLNHPSEDNFLVNYARKLGLTKQTFPLYSLGFPGDLTFHKKGSPRTKRLHYDPQWL